MIENTLTTVSYKKIKMYRSCPYSVYLKYIKYSPEPPPDPKYDAKRERGIRVHDELAECINRGAPVPPEAEDFAEIIQGYIDLGAIAEGDEYFDRQWNKLPSTTTYRDPHWLVIKKDVRVVVPGEYSLVADWKTGKKHGNELDHFEQMKLYAISEFVVDSGLPEYAVELQYLDQKDTWTHSFKPHELEKHLSNFEKDVDIMFADKTFRPKPNIHTCRYCPYNKSRGTGVCPVAAV